MNDPLDKIPISSVDDTDKHHRVILDYGCRMQAEKKERSSPVRRKAAQCVLAASLTFSFVAIVLCSLLIRQPLRLFVDQMERIQHGRYHILLAPSFVIQPGLDLEKADFLSVLDENGYRRRGDAHLGAQEFYQEGNFLYLKNDAAGAVCRIELQSGRVLSLHDAASGEALEKFVLASHVITSFLHSIWERRRPMKYEELPRDLIEAVIATEDKNFFSHWGIDPPAIVRAGIVNIRQGRVAQGASTITQQLVKVLLQRSERNWQVKIEETIIAILAEMRFSKAEILGAYLNNVYLGQVGRFEIRGVAMAANLIVGKNLADCSTSENAMLAGLIRSPNSASPLLNPLAAVSRTRTVLQQMEAQDTFLVSKTIVSNYHRKINSADRVRSASYYFAALEEELRQERLLPRPLSPPLTIELAFDENLQENIVHQMALHLAGLERKKGLKKDSLQGAVVVVNVEDGSVVAMAGGRDYQQSPFNRAVNASRQVGSLIKPFSYLISLGGTGFAAELTQASMVSDSRIRIDYDRISWKPRNYDGKYLGPITLREAIARSRNIPAVRIGLQGGLDRVADLLVDLSINPAPDRRPALLLGACESQPLSMAGAYATLANGGRKVRPGMMRRVTAGDTILWQRPEAQPFLSPAASYVMTDILRSVFTHGSGVSIKGFAKDKNIAGKTGTTSGMRDAWFAGYTPEVAMVVWIGRDDNKPVGFDGASAALPLWRTCMKSYLEKVVVHDFAVPSDIRFVEINPRNGRPAVDSAGPAETMAFIKGTEPKTSQLSLHANNGGKAFKL